MATFINPMITIIEPKKNKNLGYYTVLEKDDTNSLKIKAKSFSGRKRGVVGEIKKDGDIVAPPEVMKYITVEIRRKILTVLELIYSQRNKDLKVKRGLVNFIA